MIKQILKNKIFRWVVSFLIFIILILAFFYFRAGKPEKIEWGINFTSTHTKHLGLDSKKVYLHILDELKPKYLRLTTHWHKVEPEPGKFDFSEIKFQLEEANKRQVKVIVVTGLKQPRWPECHQPAWYNDLSDDAKFIARQKYITETVNSLKQFAAIEMWQVENEPIFGFGPNCPKLSRKALSQEIVLVKGLDPTRPTIVTDSGELGRWLPTATTGADYFGSTMYRVVHNPKFGYFSYPLPPGFFKIKTGMLNTFAKPQKLFGVELQAEPWFADDVLSTPLDEQYKLMNSEIFRDNIQYAIDAGFERNYLWGAEWWYWMKEKNNDPSIWEAAKQVFVGDYK